MSFVSSKVDEGRALAEDFCFRREVEGKAVFLKTEVR